MTDPAQARGAGHVGAIPKPTCMRLPGPLGRPAPGGPAPSAGGVPPQVSSRAELAAGVPQPPVPAARGTALGTQCGPAVGGRSDSPRTAVRGALDAALTGVSLTRRDRQFLSRLVHWDKRNAASVAALLWLARLTGRDEAALTPRQLDVVLGALSDAFEYRSSGADALGCWDCENIPGGSCADHARDADRARTYAELASVLSGGLTQADLPRPTDIAGYRSRTPVAS
jgi:hypothetical protein